MAKPKGKAKRQRDSVNDVDSTHAGSAKKQRTGSNKSGRGVPEPLVDKSVFGKMVKEAGLLLMAGDNPNQLGVDQVMFQKRLKKAVKSHLNSNQIIEEFITGLQNHIEDPVRFKYSLLPTSSSADCQSSRGGSQDSLVRILLGIDDIQPPLVNMLLEKLPEFMGEEDSMFDYSEAVDLPKLILNQFHWMDNIVNSKEMTDKMFEMVEISSPSVQREIISCITEIVSDQEHCDVATRLKNMLECNTQLMVPIVDALDNLKLPTDLLREVRRSALQNIVSADLEDLPVIIKFILQSVSSVDALEVISELRRNLDFHTMTAQPTPSTARGTSTNKTTADNELLILETIKSTLRFNKVLADGWQKAIENVPSGANHKVLDIIVLLMSHAIANRKKPVEAIFRRKVRQGRFTEELLQATFTSHAQVIRDYLNSLLCIAEKLLKSPEPQVSQFGATMYKKAFLAFDLHSKQEVIGALVTHIGSGLAAEMDSALDILMSLASSHTSDLAPFAVFIKGVLDYLDNLTLLQVKKLFSVLAALAYKGGHSVSTIQDELHIVVRKNLTSTSPKYRRIGVVAALMVIQNMASNRPEASNGRSVVQALPPDVLKQVLALLELVRTNTGQAPESAALFFDELANIVQKGNLHPRILETVGENILDEFQNDFIVDIEPETINGDNGLPMGEMYSMEGEESQGGVAINLLPLIHKAERDRHKHNSPSNKKTERFIAPTSLAPHFRLLRVCEQARNEGSLEGIDALLGCPLYSCQEEQVSKVTSLSRQERELLATNLLLVLNWFREAINGFASLEDAEMRGKVLGRLQQITHLQGLVDNCLQELPGFVPPPAHFDCDQPQASPALNETKPSKKGKKPKSDKKKIVEEETCDNTMLTEYDYVTQDKESDKPKAERSDSSTPVIDWSKSRGFLRELDFEVFSVLGCGLVSKTILDTDMNTKEVQVLQLQPRELSFLLQDLKAKLDHALPAALARRSFLKAKFDRSIGFTHLDQLSSRQVAKKTIKMLPYLCQHLEATSGFFQALMAENDGVIDGPGWNSDEAYLMGECLHLLLSNLLTLFSWNGFASSENHSPLEEALSTLSSRIADSSNASISMAQSLKNAIMYIENFSGTTPKLPIGVTILQLLVSLNSRGNSPAAKKKIASLSESLLKRDWLDADGVREKGAKHNESLQTVLEIYLHNTEDPLSVAERMCCEAIPELDPEDKNSASDLYPTLNRHSLSCYYHVMLKELVSCSQRLGSGSAADQEAVMDSWNSAVKVFARLVNLVKVFDLRTNIKSLLKYGRLFLEAFLRHGMLLMDKLFRTEKNEVQALLKLLQQCTRSLQHVCSHSKVAKDVSLTNHVPQMKRLLEQFVCRVKVMLTLHNCHEAFWVGNLKNRDLKGEEIPSQVSVADTDREEDEEEDGESVVQSSDESSNENQEDGGNNSDSDVSCSESF